MKLLIIKGQPAAEWAKTASNQDVIDEQRKIVDTYGWKGPLEYLENYADYGTFTPTMFATVFLSTPGGMGTNDFGTKVMKWGSGDADAMARAQTLTREELEQGGVTKEMAKEWRDFYRDVKTQNPGNPSAAGREQLMQRAYELLGGK